MKISILSLWIVSLPFPTPLPKIIKRNKRLFITSVFQILRYEGMQGAKLFKVNVTKILPSVWYVFEHRTQLLSFQMKEGGKGYFFFCPKVPLQCAEWLCILCVTEVSWLWELIQCPKTSHFQAPTARTTTRTTVLTVVGDKTFSFSSVWLLCVLKTEAFKEPQPKDIHSGPV